MAKKPLDPEKVFMNTLRNYLGSISARSCQYAYFNVAPNTIVLSNTTSPPPNDEHGDRLMDFSVGELGIHIIEFKDPDFVVKLKQFLKINDTDYYVIHIVNLISILNKFKLTALDVFENEIGEKVVINHGRKTYDKKNIVGSRVHNFHVVREIYNWYLKITEIGSTAHQQTCPWVEIPMNTQIFIHGRVYTIPIDTDAFKHLDGTPVFSHVNPKLNILGLDGLTSVSIQEFIKKLQPDTFTFTNYFWVVGEHYVLSMTKFEDNIVKVRSSRPNILSIPIPDNVKIEGRDIIHFEEISTDGTKQPE